MSARALWIKEYRQARGLLWAIFATVTTLLTLRVLQQLGHMERLASEGSLLRLHLPINVGLPFFLPALVIALACLQIGAERSHGGDHFTFSLPYSRPRIFLVKWALGAATIVVSLALNGWLTYLRIAASPLAEDVVVWPALGPYTLQLLAASLATYTLALFVGALAGSTVFQAAFSVIFGIFPSGFLILLAFALDLHLEVLSGQPFLAPDWARWVADTGAPYLSVLTHFFALPSPGLDWNPWESAAVTLTSWATIGRLVAVDLALVAGFLAWGAYLYSRNRLEYDGLMLVIPGARGFFAAGITGCFGLLGGFIAALGGGWNTGGLLSYYVGALVLGGLAYAFTRRLLWRPAAKRREV